MSYCTKQDLIDEGWEAELIQLTDQDGTGQIDDVTLGKSIARADSVINRYLGGRTDLPLLASEVVDLACDIARYFLYGNQMIDVIEKRYNGALDQLKLMAKRELAIVDADGQTDTVDAVVTFQSNTSVFGRDA